MDVGLLLQKRTCESANSLCKIKMDVVSTSMNPMNYSVSKAELCITTLLLQLYIVENLE